MTVSKLRIGIIGCGYWGPNLVRNFSSLANCEVVMVSDKKKERLDFIKNEFPNIKTSLDCGEVLRSPEIEAVCIATPVMTHKALAIEALESGKHVFVEKPMAASSTDAKLMVETAHRCERKLAVGHVFQFAPAVRGIKKLLNEDAIGEVFHISSARINLGPPETDINVIWDLGPHDLSIIIYLLDDFPMETTSYKRFYPFGFSAKDKSKLINDVDINLKFASNKSAHIHLSWLSSNKTRLMQIFGSNGTIVYDEMLALDGKVKLYGKGIDSRIEQGHSNVLSYQSGEIQIIQLEQHEPLRMECEHFVNCVLNNTDLINDGDIGLKVVSLLELI